MLLLLPENAGLELIHLERARLAFLVLLENIVIPENSQLLLVTALQAISALEELGKWVQLLLLQMVEDCVLLVITAYQEHPLKINAQKELIGMYKAELILILVLHVLQGFIAQEKLR